MYGLLLFSFLLQFCFLSHVLCLRPDLNEEQKIALQKYMAELDAAHDKSSYVDPNDIFKDLSSFEPLSQENIHDTPVIEEETLENQEKIVQEANDTEKCEKSEEGCEKKSTMISNDEIIKREADSKNTTIYFRRWMKMFLNKFTSFGGKLQNKVISIRINDEALNQINSVLNMKAVNFFNVDHIIQNILSNVIVHEELNWYEMILGYWKLTLGVILVILISTLYIKSPKATLFIFFIVLCTAWQWKQLHEEAIARKHADLEQMHFPTVCRRHELSFLENIRLWLQGFTVSQGTCRDYYKAVMVDPFWEVTPSMAFSAALSKFFLYPLEVLAETANNFIKILLKDLSVFYVVAIFVILFVLLMMCFKYRIRLPFFLTIEPVVTEPANRLPSSSMLSNAQSSITTRENSPLGNDSNSNMVTSSNVTSNHTIIRRINSCVNNCLHRCDKILDFPKQQVSKTLDNSCCELTCCPEQQVSKTLDKSDVCHGSCSHHDNSQISSQSSQPSIESASQNLEAIEFQSQSKEDSACLLTSELACLKIGEDISLNSENATSDNLNHQNVLSCEMENLNLKDDDKHIQPLSELRLLGPFEIHKDQDQSLPKVPSSEDLIDLKSEDISKSCLESLVDDSKQDFVVI